MKQNATQHTLYRTNFDKTKMDITRLGAANKFANNISTQQSRKPLERSTTRNGKKIGKLQKFLDKFEGYRS